MYLGIVAVKFRERKSRQGLTHGAVEICPSIPEFHYTLKRPLLTQNYFGMRITNEVANNLNIFFFYRFGEGYVAFLRFSQPVTAKELTDAISRHLSRAQVSSRQATAARLMVPRSVDVSLSETYLRVKRLAEDLKATDYTLTQSSLDQVNIYFKI